MAPVPGMFDVFLNHRGPDVKQNFAAHLHQALQEAGCRPFLDMESLEKGQHGQKKIYEALACASVHVAIFSKHYADSNYCLDELCAMLERKKLIIPVFYDVSPNDLHCKLHNGPYTKAFRETHGRRPASEVKKWKDALCMAAQLFGFQLANYNGDEAQLKTAIGTNKVRGLSTFGVGHGGNGATNVAENYIGMNRLHFLLLDGDNVKGDFSTWSRELSWLQWMNSNLLALPLELDLRKLAVLDLTSNKELMQIWPNDLEV
ncbi:unnamed protein product [Sphagnum jensenii]